MSLFDPLDHKVLLPEMEEIEDEPKIPQVLFGPLRLPEWLSIFLGTYQISLKAVDNMTGRVPPVA